jgi:hypothetical protein
MSDIKYMQPMANFTLRSYELSTSKPTVTTEEQAQALYQLYQQKTI